METVLITRHICLPSRFLDKNINEHILGEMSELTKDECGKEYGHIVSIKSIKRIIDQKIGRAEADNVFTVEFEALTFNPKVGKEVPGSVCMVYKDGIFLRIMGKQLLLVPASALQGYHYSEINNSYEGNESTIELGDEVNAIITASQYSNRSFSCLGTLKDL